MTKNQVTTAGIYEYRLPDDEKSVFVTVFQDAGEIYVKFKGKTPVRMSEISHYATFSKWI
jgi:hypothetical protein